MLNLKRYFVRIKEIAHQINELIWYAKETFKHDNEIKTQLAHLEQTNQTLSQQIQDLTALFSSLNTPKASDRILAYDPELVPPNDLLKLEGVLVMEEWFAWANEWSWFLRDYGALETTSKVLEIGCGLGRIALPLRILLNPPGSYDGFEIVKQKIDFLHANFQKNTLISGLPTQMCLTLSITPRVSKMPKTIAFPIQTLLLI